MSLGGGSNQKKLKENPLANSNSNSKPKKAALIPPPVLTSTFQAADNKNYDEPQESSKEKKAAAAAKKKNIFKSEEIDVITGLNLAVETSQDDEFELIDKINLNNENCFIKPKVGAFLHEKKQNLGYIMQQTPSESSLINSNGKKSKIVIKKPNSTGSLNLAAKTKTMAVPPSPKFYCNDNYYNSHEQFIPGGDPYANLNTLVGVSKPKPVDANYFKHIENFYKPADLHYLQDNHEMQKLYKMSHMKPSTSENQLTGMTHHHIHHYQHQHTYADPSDSLLGAGGQNLSGAGDKSLPEPQMCVVSLKQNINLNKGKIANIKNFNSGIYLKQKDFFIKLFACCSEKVL